MTGLSMPHLFFETDEGHSDIPDTSMRRVLSFFDSVFVRSPAAVRPRSGFNAQTQRRTMPAGNVTWYDIRGRRLAAVAATDKRYFHDASGIRIAKMPDAVYRVFFRASR
jgi:hypothetical protein